MSYFGLWTIWKLNINWNEIPGENCRYLYWRENLYNYKTAGHVMTSTLTIKVYFILLFLSCHYIQQRAWLIRRTCTISRMRMTHIIINIIILYFQIYLFISSQQGWPDGAYELFLICSTKDMNLKIFVCNVYIWCERCTY